MPEMLLINPRRRRRKQPRVNGRFVSAKRRRRRRNPIAALANPRRRRRRRATALAAPRRRRRVRRHAVALHNPRRRRRSYARVMRRRRRHNPRGAFAFSPRGALRALIPAGIGAAGAVALDIAMNYVPLPAQFQSPLWKNAARIIGALGVGYLSSFALGKERAKIVTVGALTVAAYGVLRDVIAQNFPSIGLSGIQTYDMSDLRMGYTNPAPMLEGMGAYMRDSLVAPNPGVGAYMRDTLDTVNMHGMANDGM